MFHKTCYNQLIVSQWPTLSPPNNIFIVVGYDLTVLLLQPQKLVESECRQADLVEMLFSED